LVFFSLFHQVEETMNWFTDTLSTSIGKKLMMALTGLAFCGFLATHLAGNLTLYIGREAFLGYAEHLHSFGPLLLVAEWGLLLLAIIHVATGMTLFYQNWRSRPTGYAVKRSAGGRTIGSRTMPYTGILLLLFIILHLLNFHFVDKTGTNIYIIAMIVAAIHVSHGLWSAFQTLGVNHPKYTPFLWGLSIVFSVIIGIGFGFIPIFISISV
jgi:succinate dehydrogenase / fumarate reductase cytochrome b subunit